MKRLTTIVLASIMISGTLFTTSNAQDNTYETYTKPIQRVYTKEQIPKEIKSDMDSLQDIKYLKLKTSSNYEVAISNSDGTYTYVSSKEDLQSAIDIAKEQLSKQKNNSIPVVINKDGLVVYATEGIGRIIRMKDGVPSTSIDTTVNLYKTSELKSPEHTNINHFYVDDVPVIESNGNTSKIEVSGFTGYLKNAESDGSTNLIVVPINQAKGLSYYNINSNNELVHAISSDVTTATKYSYQTLGKAPSYIKSGTKYYSYDGNYFYTNINTLISDAKANNHNNAVNANSPYYNYYQYLPGRSKTSYTAQEINKYIEKNTVSGSVLRNSGQHFINAQNNYGVNALMSVGIAMNESDKGTSSMAKTKNNIFGANAKDGYPQGSDRFKSIEECISRVSNYSFSNGFFNPKSWKYNGSALGNKNMGTNIRYASDPYWAEKAISNMYQMDKFLGGSSGLKDYNRYLLGIYTNPTEVKTTLSKDLYSILPDGSRTNKNPAHGQVGDSTILISNNSGNYEIRPDRIVSVNETNINGDGTYLWDRYGVVGQGNVKSINQVGNIKTDFNTWAKSYIVDAMNKGWVDTTNTFNPENSITRAEFIKIVNRAFNLTQEANEGFVDVNTNDWFYKEVRIAVKAGYINGRSSTQFAPHAPITRQEAAKIIGILIGINNDCDIKTSFADDTQIENWADGYVQGLRDRGILDGYDGNVFKPNNNIKRGEAVKILSVAK